MTVPQAWLWRCPNGHLTCAAFDGGPCQRVPLWPCLCGARNRLRDLTCQSCGGPKP